MKALADPAVRSRIVDLGNDVFPREEQTPGALSALFKRPMPPNAGRSSTS